MGNLVKILPKPPKKYCISTAITYYELMILGDYSNLVSVSENSILTILKATQVSEAAAINNLYRRFLKDEVKFLSKPISDFCNLRDSCKVAKLRLLYKIFSLTQPCNYRPISLLPLISKVKEKVIHNQAVNFLNLKNLLYTY